MWRTPSAVLALALTACTGPQAGGAEAEHETTAAEPVVSVPATSTATGTEPRAPADDVLEALDGFVRSTIAVNDPPDPDHPDLARYRMGVVLDRARSAVRQNQVLGISYRLPAAAAFRHVASVTSLADDRAIVRDCVVDDAQQIAVRDGQVLNATVATKLFETTLVRVDGQWKVDENVLVDRWEGVAGCADGSGRP